MLKLVKSAQRPEIETNKPKVLIVDTDLPVLLSLKRQLRSEFDIEVAINPRQALELLESHGPFAVIVSDMHLPGMDGVEFLSRSRRICPDTSRIMLSADLERDTALCAVNEGGVLSFVEKPCPIEDIAAAVAKGVEVYDRRTHADSRAAHMLADFQNELRAPLLHILDFARIIRDGVASQGAMREYARQIVETGGDLLNTSETILDLIALQNGALQPNPKPIEIGRLARAAIKPEARLAAAKGVEIDLQTGAHPFTAVIDERLTLRALGALISNAVKASRMDARVTLSVRPIGEEEAHVCFEVRDEGDGFPDHMLTRLRAPFARGDRQLRTGFGLPLAWSSARLQEGYLELENHDEGGASARLILPAYPQA